MATYRARVPTFEAVQFFTVDDPWPAGVDDCEAMEGPHLHMAVDIMPLVDGDWIVTDENAMRSRYSDADFAAKFEPVTVAGKPEE